MNAGSLVTQPGRGVRRVWRGPGGGPTAAPMRAPGTVAVAVRLPVAPTLGQVASDEAARASSVLPVGEAASQRAVIPAGAVIVPSALTAAKSTSLAPATEVLTDGAVTAVPGFGARVAAAASTGWAVSTPE